MYYRLIKPIWGKPLVNGQANPLFENEIEGPDTLEGSFNPEDLKHHNTKGYNIYFFPNSPSTVPEEVKFINGKHIDTFEYVFIDMDLKDGEYTDKDDFLSFLAKFPLQPTTVVDSGNGIHAYWKIKELDRMSYMLTQFSLINYFQTDQSVWTPLQLMRVYGYFNTKESDNFKMAGKVATSSSDVEYTLEQLYTHLKAPTEKQGAKADKHNDKLNGDYEAIELDADLDQVCNKFQRLLDVWALFNDPKGTYGERSGADMSLCNALYGLGFSRKEASTVLFQTQKALERETDRLDYVQGILDIVYSDRSKKAALTVEEWLKVNKTIDSFPVNGPRIFDNFERGWSKGDILGMVAGTGIGKTAVSMSIVKELIANNPDSDELNFFFTLEMPEKQIVKRWLKLVGGDKEYQKKLIVKGNDSSTERIGPQQIYDIVTQTCKKMGKKPGTVIIDHFQVLSKTIDAGHEINWGVGDNHNFGKGIVKSVDLQSLCDMMKILATKLDCFLILQNQTTKEKSGKGDMPLDVTAAYGAAQFEWICDFLITIWQPLYLVQAQTEMCITAYQYCKIRETDEHDILTKGEMYPLLYDQSTGDFAGLSQEQYDAYHGLLAQARELRKQQSKGEEQYVQVNKPSTKVMDAGLNKRIGKRGIKVEGKV